MKDHRIAFMLKRLAEDINNFEIVANELPDEEADELMSELWPKISTNAKKVIQTLQDYLDAKI